MTLKVCSECGITNHIMSIRFPVDHDNIILCCSCCADYGKRKIEELKDSKLIWRTVYHGAIFWAIMAHYRHSKLRLNVHAYAIGNLKAQIRLNYGYTI